VVFFVPILTVQLRSDSQDDFLLCPDSVDENRDGDAMADGKGELKLELRGKKDDTI
jgi:hypothetical protein